MTLAVSGSASATNASVGVCRTPVWRPTSVRSTPVRDSSAAAVSARAASSP